MDLINALDSVTSTILFSEPEFASDTFRLTFNLGYSFLHDAEAKCALDGIDSEDCIPQQYEKVAKNLYSSFWQSFRNWMMAFVGNTAFVEEFLMSEEYPRDGWLVVGLFQVMLNVILLNILISMLASMYMRIQQTSRDQWMYVVGH